MILIGVLAFLVLFFPLVSMMLAGLKEPSDG
jgi:hypothetical protein